MDRAVCDVHDAWGREIEKRASEADPLRMPILMEMQLAAFKKHSKKNQKHVVHESDERHMHTCYVPTNRLRMAAIENKQAALKKNTMYS